MNTMINPAALANPAAVKKESINTSGKSEGSFLHHMTRQMKNDDRQNLLGVAKSNQTKAAAAQGKAQAKSAAGAQAKRDINDNENQVKIAKDLKELLDNLRKALEEGSTKPGEWGLALPDASLLTQAAQDAGMSKTDLSVLLKKMEENSGQLDLAQFLQFFSNHFEKMGETVPVKLPETELPFLESLLARMGVGQDAIKQISYASVSGDNQFDLKLFLQKLNGVASQQVNPAVQQMNSQQQANAAIQTMSNLEPQNPAAGGENAAELPAIPLSNFEKERLVDMFRQAGVSEDMLASMFAEVGDDTLALDLAKFKEMLAQGIKNIDQKQQAQADYKKFFADLAQVLSESGFNEQSVGWTPVVQKAVESLYQELMAAVDFSKVKISQPSPTSAPAKPVAATTSIIDDDVIADPNVDEAVQFVQDSDPAGTGAGASRKGLLAAMDAKPVAKDSSLLQEAAQGVHGKNEAAYGVRSGQENELIRPPAEPQAIHVTRTVLDFEQQTLTQLTSGVLKGIKNGEHHMILKLQPPELGEVRVELTVKDHQVSVSFAMENSRVKEILENNMGMFRENMADKGFVLQECMVSLGQNSDQNDAWQRFASSFSSGNGPSVENLADLPREAIYNRPEYFTDRPDAISIFV